MILITSVRLAPVYGATKRKHFDLIGSLIGQLLERGEAEVSSTRPERDFIYVEDAADAIVQLLEADYTGVVNLGTGTLTAVSRMQSLIAWAPRYSIEEGGRAFQMTKALRTACASG